MSAAEMIHRGGSLLNHTIKQRAAGPAATRQAADRVLGGFPRPLHKCVAGESRLKALSHADRATFEEFYPDRALRVVRRAEQGCRHVVSFFDLEECALGERINWHKDYKLGVVAPLEYGPRMDFRDPMIVGNVNYVWELNRHQHLVEIAKAYYISGDERFAQECVRQIASWLESNPYPLGINWNSGLELSIRLISWLWVAHFIAGSSSADEQWWERLLLSIRQHVTFVHENYSAYSSANNHLVGEAAGVFLASVCFPQFKEAREWQEKSCQILKSEICKQTFPDGVGKEQSTAYQTFTTTLMMLCGIVGRRTGIEFGAEYWGRIRASCEFLSRLMDCAGHVPNIGDATDSRAILLDEEESFPPYKSVLAIGASLFEDGLMRGKAECFPEAAFWILGRDGFTRFEAIPARTVQRSSSFPQGGYAILHRGHTSSDELSLLFDSGPLGYLSIAAHGHADALSFTLSAHGKNFFIDPGTYLYFVDPEWRAYFKGTAAHNTVRIDHLDQAENGGDFVWLKHYRARLDKWESSDTSDHVEGSHDGYHRLNDPVACHRSITLDKQLGLINIVDTIGAAHPHLIEQFFHLSADCKVHHLAGSLWRIENSGHSLEIEFDKTTTIDVFEGSTDPILGWESLGYGRKRPSPTIRTTRAGSGTCRLLTFIRT
jgi:hypothetical protein